MTSNSIRISFLVNELAEIYCAQTLEKHLSILNPNFHFSFDISGIVERAKPLAQTLSLSKREDNQLGIRFYSDLSRNVGLMDRQLEIDQSILKNMIRPVEEEEKQMIRKEYSIVTTKPITVISHCEQAKNLENLHKLISTFSKYSVVYLFDYFNDFRAPNTTQILPTSDSNVFIVRGYGSLKKFFAIADVCVYGENIEFNEKNMHNINESTENGKLFIVPPALSQYGFKAGVKGGYIFSCSNFEDLFERATNYLKEFNGKDFEALRLRDMHFETTRQKYLPVLLSHINSMLDRNLTNVDSDLRALAYCEQGYNIRRLMHPETVWRPKYNDEIVFEDSNLPF
jgi:hypothetical protein